MPTPTDPRVAAIRADKIVGVGTCSPIDECYTDAELAAYLDDAGIGPRAVQAAVREARATHRVWAERQAEYDAMRHW